MLTEFLENPASLEMFVVAPSLTDVTLRKVVFDWDGPTITMSVEVKEYPEHPPIKWQMKKFDAVIIDLQLLGVDGVGLKGWTTDNIVQVLLTRLPAGNIRVHAVGPEIDFEIVCGWLRISGIRPYHNAKAY